MKKSKPYRPSSPEKAGQKLTEKESAEYSFEAISNRSLAKTEVLNEMLERERKAYNLRYWGINE